MLDKNTFTYRHAEIRPLSEESQELLAAVASRSTCSNNA
ncbi:Uncharacterised protein [Serratia fonticola]|uniref:Uncharacterized protein n=1 Tax=Serratia fonticola TaxID=47917 RepID=A0A4U9TUD2_SERFO|nr:Uncharacterised protein [Serratia fonticola]